MKVLNLMLASAGVLALASCGDGLGSPEEAGAKLAQMEYDQAMRELDQQEEINDLKIEEGKFENKVLEKYGNDPEAAAKMKQGATAKKTELQNKYEDRKKEIERKREDALDKVKRESKALDVQDDID